MLKEVFQKSVLNDSAMPESGIEINDICFGAQEKIMKKKL